MLALPPCLGTVRGTGMSLHSRPHLSIPDIGPQPAVNSVELMPRAPGAINSIQ